MFTAAMSDDYIPIACGQHSEYELAIMHKQTLRIVWQDPKQEQHTLLTIPTDIVTRDHAEFLLVTDTTGNQLELRLDKIINAQAV